MYFFGIILYFSHLRYNSFPKMFYITVTSLYLITSTQSPSIDAHAFKSAVDDSIPHNDDLKDYFYDDSSNNTNITFPQGQLTADEEAKMCKKATCVRKCCPEGKYMSLYLEYGCLDLNGSEPKFEPQFRHKDGRPAVPDTAVNFLYGSDLKICPMYGPLPEHRSFILLSDGSLYTNHQNIDRNASRYCIDVIKRDDQNFGVWPIICYNEMKETTRTLFRFYGHATCLVLSSLALLFIVVCHIALPKLRDLSGLCLLSYASCLLIADIALLVASLGGQIKGNSCVLLGMVIHSSFLAAYCWLSVICFDIWRIVRMSVKGIGCAFLPQQERRLFVCYSLSVWGSIVVIACVTITMQFLPQDALSHSIVRPHFGVKRCFILDDDANLLAYFFSILAILGALNLIFVGVTIRYLYDAGVKLCCIKKTLPSSQGTVFNKDLDIFWQRFQIFAMTVVVWTTEILSWKIPPKEMWEATDLLNTLQGVVLLVIFLQSKRIRQMLLVKATGLLRKSQAEDLRMGSRVEQSQFSEAFSIHSN